MEQTATQYILSIETPSLFSLLPPSNIEQRLANIENNFKKLGDILSKTTFAEFNRQAFSQTLIAISKNIDNLKKLAQSFQQPSWKIILARSALASISHYLTYPKDLIKDPNVLFTINHGLNFIQENLQEIVLNSDEAIWYYALAIHFKAYIAKNFVVSRNNHPITLYKHTLDDCRIIASLLTKIKSSSHKQAIFIFFHEYYTFFYKDSDIYPDYSLFKHVEGHLPSGVESLQPEFMQLGYKYISRNLKRPQYFDFNNSKLLTDNLNNAMEIEVKILKEESILGEAKNFKITITPNQNNSLFKFSAHIGSLSRLAFKFRIPDINEARANIFNIELRKKMRAQKLCNSEGFITKEAITEVGLNQIKDMIVQTLDEPRFKIFSDDKQKQNYKGLIKFELDKIKLSAEKMKKSITALNGYKTFAVRILFYNCLNQYQYGLPTELLNKVKKSVLQSLELSNAAQIINETANTDRTKLEGDMFELAGKVVNYVADNKCDLLINLGAPIKSQKNTASSKHTFYAVLKHMDNGHMRVIITNGGSGIEFHTPVPEQEDIDWKYYYYAGLNPFELNDANKDKLKHYLYKLLMLRFTETSNDENYKSKMKNIYLRQIDNKNNCYFYGYNDEKIYGFRQEDLDKTFLQQVAGNCTVYNLKYALKVMHDMDDITFGLMLNNLMLGVDEFAEKLENAYAPTAGNNVDDSDEASSYPLSQNNQNFFRNTKNIEREIHSSSSSNINSSSQYNIVNEIYDYSSEPESPEDAHGLELETDEDTKYKLN